MQKSLILNINVKFKSEAFVFALFLPRISLFAFFVAMISVLAFAEFGMKLGVKLLEKLLSGKARLCDDVLCDFREAIVKRFVISYRDNVTDFVPVKV